VCHGGPAKKQHAADFGFEPVDHVTLCQHLDLVRVSCVCRVCACVRVRVRVCVSCAVADGECGGRRPTSRRGRGWRATTLCSSGTRRR
jgi:hypothetical protein